MSEKPLISVVIPTYNRADLIGKAIQSVLDQSFTDWEILVVDNHSQDVTDEVVAKFGDSRIRLLKIHNNGVIAASRNLGIREARGEWVAFLDSDDWWLPEKLEKCLPVMRSGCEGVCHGERYISPDSQRDIVYGPEWRTKYENLLFYGNCFSTSAMILRREILMEVGGFSEDLAVATAEDYDLWLKLSKIGCHFVFVEDICGVCLIHEGNETRSVVRHTDAIGEVVKRHLPHAEVVFFFRWIFDRKAKSLVFYSGGRAMQKLGLHREALGYFVRAIAEWPFVFRFYIALGLNAFGVKKY